MVDLDAEWDWADAGLFCFLVGKEGGGWPTGGTSNADVVKGQANHFFRYAPEKVYMTSIWHF